MKIGKLQAAVYWGAPDDFGTGPSFKVGNTLIEPTYTFMSDLYSPDYFTEHYKTFTDVVLSHNAFCREAYTIDLSKKSITFYEWERYPSFAGKKVYLESENVELPFVKGRVFDNDLILQLDIGDEVTILHKDIFTGLKPVEEISLYINVNDVKKTTLPLYDVPIQLSHSVTINVRARPISEKEESSNIALCTHGCLGVDLLRNHAVTFGVEIEPRTMKYRETMYLNEFKV